MYGIYSNRKESPIKTSQTALPLTAKRRLLKDVQVEQEDIQEIRRIGQKLLSCIQTGFEGYYEGYLDAAAYNTNDFSFTESCELHHCTNTQSVAADNNKPITRVIENILSNDKSNLSQRNTQTKQKENLPVKRRQKPYSHVSSRVYQIPNRPIKQCTILQQQPQNNKPADCSVKNLLKKDQFDKQNKFPQKQVHVQKIKKATDSIEETRDESKPAFLKAKHTLSKQGIYERSLSQLRVKQQRIKQEKIKIAEREEICTFHPKTNRNISISESFEQRLASSREKYRYNKALLMKEELQSIKLQSKPSSNYSTIRGVLGGIEAIQENHRTESRESKERRSRSSTPNVVKLISHNTTHNHNRLQHAHKETSSTAVVSARELDFLLE